MLSNLHAVIISTLPNSHCYAEKLNYDCTINFSGTKFALITVNLNFFKSHICNRPYLLNMYSIPCVHVTVTESTKQQQQTNLQVFMIIIEWVCVFRVDMFRLWQMVIKDKFIKKCYMLITSDYKHSLLWTKQGCTRKPRYEQFDFILSLFTIHNNSVLLCSSS